MPNDVPVLELIEQVNDAALVFHDLRMGCGCIADAPNSGRPSTSATS